MNCHHNLTKKTKQKKKQNKKQNKKTHKETNKNLCVLHAKITRFSFTFAPHTNAKCILGSTLTTASLQRRSSLANSGVVEEGCGLFPWWIGT